MRAALFIVLAASGVAFADPFPEDAPRVEDVMSGVIGVGVAPDEYETYEIKGGQYFNAAAVKVLNFERAGLYRAKAALEVENATLKAINTKVAEQPGLNTPNVLLLAGGGFLAGVVATIAVILVTR